MLMVQKYGGSSLADAERIDRAARCIARQVRQGHRLVVVVSAQGDTTDLLLTQMKQVAQQPPLRELDACLSAGEQVSAALMAAALEAIGLPAVSLTGYQAGIMTDGHYTDAHVLGLRGNRIRQELNRGRTVVVTGFQGLGPEGDITTLGRGGSDTTAVALAAFLGADRCMIYTDVDGVYDKDPRKYPEAVRYERIGYDAMLALARGGAQVLHDRCVELAKRYQVPVRVLSSFRGGEGTLVSDEQ